MFSLRITGFLRPQTWSLTSNRATYSNRKKPLLTEKAEKAAKPVLKLSERQVDFSSKPRLQSRALTLIFGDRPYSSFSEKERRLVDGYQNYIDREAPIVLPNTWRSEENKTIQRLFGENIFYGER